MHSMACTYSIRTAVLLHMTADLEPNVFLESYNEVTKIPLTIFVHCKTQYWYGSQVPC